MLYENTTVHGDKCLDNNKVNMWNYFHIIAKKIKGKWLNPKVAEAGIFQENWVNSIVADILFYLIYQANRSSID